MKPWNIAHRGGAALRPENTLAAFAHACELGCDGIELDVQLTKDGAAVVFHDFTLSADLCRDAHDARVVDLHLEELRRYRIQPPDPASRYAHTHPDVVWQGDLRIPTLDEAIEAVAASPLRMFVELKSCFYDAGLSASPDAMAEAALAAAEKGGALARTVFVGFDWRALLAVKRRAPQATTWFTTMPLSWFADAPPASDEPPSEQECAVLRTWAQSGTSPWAGGFDAVKHEGSIVRAIAAAGGDGWFPFHRDASAAAIAEAHALGLKVGAWTANDASDMRALADAGIDAICTDRPDVLIGF